MEKAVFEKFFNSFSHLHPVDTCITFLFLCWWSVCCSKLENQVWENL